MSKGGEEQFFEVTDVGEIDGPVGMDRGIWLHFDTIKGRIKLKLSHKEAGELKQKLANEVTIEDWHIPP